MKDIDVAALKDLLLWARKERIAITQASCGGVAIAMTDLAIAEPKRGARSVPEATAADVDPYKRYGGDALQATLERSGVPLGVGGTTEENSTFLDEDDDV